MRLSHFAANWAISLLLVMGTAYAQPKLPPQGTPTSGSPALEEAATKLSVGQFDAAREGFEKVADGGSALPFVRSIAMFGLAEAAVAEKDIAGAVKVLERLAEDAALPQVHRDMARRRMLEIDRQQRGMPGRDPASYRAPLPALPEPAAVFHVAPGEREGGDGSEARPFTSLEKARDAVRALKASNGGKLPKGGVRVIVHGGAYPVQSTFRLAAEDSGTADAPVVYQLRLGQTPIFTGGIRITGWKPISDEKLRQKLDPSVRNRVVEADLKALGVKDFGDATALRLRPELFCQGVPQTLARWPNEGFVKTGEILGTQTFKVWNTISGCKDGKFRYIEDRPSRWVDEPDVRLYGYWFWDWYEEYQKVASIDAAGRVITLTAPYSQYGYRKDQRYRAVNVFCEIDQPGEWYLDRRSRTVYWLPPEGINPNTAMVTFSMLAKPFVSLDNVEHVMLLGLTFQEGRGNGIQVRGGADCLVAGCTVRQLGGDAIVVEGGKHHGIFGCTLHTLGCGGTRVAGGDRKTLTPGGHFVENCTVFDISRLKRTYTPAVHLDGCGNRIAHNLFERMPSSAMRVEGNDHVVELNVIRRVVQESDDQGALDMFGNPLYRGVVIRWNHWSDITGGTECGAAGIRLDDMISDIAIHGNIFERCGAVQFGGVQIHGGKDNLVDGNLFLNCHAGVSFSRWGEKRWMEMVERFVQQAGEPPYSTRYPELARLKMKPDVNLVSRNVFAQCKSVFLRDGGMEQTAMNLISSQSIDRKSLIEQSVRTDPHLRRLLIEPIPVDEIGTYAHPWRAMDTTSGQ